MVIHGINAELVFYMLQFWKLKIKMKNLRCYKAGKGNWNSFQLVFENCKLKEKRLYYYSFGFSHLLLSINFPKLKKNAEYQTHLMAFGEC